MIKNDKKIKLTKNKIIKIIKMLKIKLTKKFIKKNKMIKSNIQIIHKTTI